MKTCKDCKQRKPLSEFYKVSVPKHVVVTSNPTSSYCKPCHVKRSHASRSDPKVKKDESYKDSWKRKRLTLSRDEVLDKLEKQNWTCPICKCGIDENYFHQDHNHETLQIRDVLCPQCNKALGLFDEDINVLKSAIEYLVRFNQMAMEEII